MRVGVVAGETSGDLLGGDLIAALKQRRPDAQFAGIAGPEMAAQGCAVWESSESLAVMGIFEVLAHLPRLLALRRRIVRRLLAWRPDVFIGIDSPEFNFGLGRILRRAGIPTVQYVSPQVWAWRQGRVRTIDRSTDLVLCLLPFEKRFYDEHGVAAEFVGHPMADQIGFDTDCAAARRELGLAVERPVIAVLPGSRLGEVRRIGPDFAATVRWLAEQRTGLQFVAPMTSAAARTEFEALLGRYAPGLAVRLIERDARRALAAADVALVASGTASLETMLVNRPMVVAYRLGALTYWLFRHFGLVKVAHIAMPNLLAGERLVPEFVQEHVRADLLGPAVLAQLDGDGRHRWEVFRQLHRRLALQASGRAADAVLGLLARRSVEVAA